MEFGGITIEFLGHSGFVIRNGVVSVAIDPYNVSPSVEKVDYILITHGHSDHCSIKDIQHLSRKGTVVVAPADSQSTITRVTEIHMETIEQGDELDLGKLKVEAVPAYNVNKYRDKDKKIVFHPKNEGYLGYVIRFGTVVVYHAGDTDLIPEMQKLTGHGKHDRRFVALLPVSGTYVMDVEEAAEAAALLKPDLAIPMHYGAGVF